MNELTNEQSTSRERTLRTSLILSAPGPLVIGIAVLSSSSTTQLADFIRRGMELAAILISWLTFRGLHGTTPPGDAHRVRMERTAGLSTAGALICSGSVLLLIAVSRISERGTGGNVIPGLVIAVLGALTNGWFWRRYTDLSRERYDQVISAQRHLYRAKTAVDLCVTAALATVAAAPFHPVTRYVDIVGSVIVAIYLLVSGLKTARASVSVAR